MSARFIKIFSGVFLAHLVVFSLVWVGFSAPGPRPPATFIYQGALPAEDTGSSSEDVWPKSKTSDQISFDQFNVSYFNNWTTLRVPSKPPIYFEDLKHSGGHQ